MQRIRVDVSLGRPAPTAVWSRLTRAHPHRILPPAVAGCLHRILAPSGWRWLAEALEAEYGRFALWAPVLMGAGVLGYFALRFEPPFWAGAAIALLALAGLAAGRGRLWPRLLLRPVAAVAIGFAAVQLATIRAPPPERGLPTRATIVTGRVISVEPLAESRRITLSETVFDAAGPPRARHVRLRLRANDTAPLATGDTVRVRAMVRPIAPPAYPGAWDQQRDAFFNGLGASGYALGKLERTSQAGPSGLTQRMQRLREAISGRITAVIPGSTGQVTVAVLLGTQSGIAPADLAAFRDSGLAHILSVSGLHIAIVMGVVMAGTRALLALSEHASLFWPTRAIAALAALTAGALYTLLTGSQVPMLRCLFTAAVFTLALLAGRRPFSLRGLASAAVVIILLEPQQVAGASLQMSFSAVLALIAGFEALQPWIHRLRGTSWLRRALVSVVGLMLTSLLAGSASMPFGIYHFGRLQVWFVLSNMVAVPLTSVLVMPAAMLALPLMLLNLEWLALLPVRWGIDATLWIAHATASLPAATLDVPPMPGWGLSVLALGLAWLCLWRSRIRLAGVAAIALGFASPVFYRPPDILVSADARLIAVHTESGVFVQRTHGGGSAFTREAWLRLWADGAARPILAGDGQQAAGAISCSGNTCLVRPHRDSRPAMLVRRGGNVAHCSEAAVIVAAEPARGLCPRPWPKLVDRFTVWRDGPAAIWLDPHRARVLTDRQARGDRPWVPPLPQRRSQQPTGGPLVPADPAPLVPADPGPLAPTDPEPPTPADSGSTAPADPGPPAPADPGSPAPPPPDPAPSVEAAPD